MYKKDASKGFFENTKRRRSDEVAGGCDGVQLSGLKVSNSIRSIEGGATHVGRVQVKRYKRSAGVTADQIGR